MSIEKYKKAYVLSHNGLGDNISMFGALNYLTNYYENVFFICKQNNYNNINYVFKNNKSITIVPIDGNNEYNDCKKIWDDNLENSDMFISGHFHNGLQRKITHPLLINYTYNNKNYSIPKFYDFIKMFYSNINMDLSIYCEYFNIEIDSNMIKYYDLISKYKIVFLHIDSSTNTIDIPSIITDYLNNNEFIVICINKNLYDISNELYEIAEKYIHLPFFYYYQIILKSFSIHVTDSSFSCLILPLSLNNKLSTKDINIYCRNNTYKIL